MTEQLETSNLLEKHFSQPTEEWKDSLNLSLSFDVSMLHGTLSPDLAQSASPELFSDSPEEIATREVGRYVFLWEAKLQPWTESTAPLECVSLLVRMDPYDRLSHIDC